MVGGDQEKLHKGNNFEMRTISYFPSGESYMMSGRKERIVYCRKKEKQVKVLKYEYEIYMKYISYKSMLRMKHLANGHMSWLKGNLEMVASTRQIILTLASFLKTGFPGSGL